MAKQQTLDDDEVFLTEIPGFLAKKVFKNTYFIFILLAVIVLAPILGPLLVDTKLMFTSHDLLGFFWSAYRFYHDNFNNGNGVALWYTFHSTGVPMLGNPELLPFYPLYWLNFFLPTSLALSYVVFFSLLLTGLFGLILAYKILNLSRGTSFFLAITLLLTPKLFAHLYAGHIGLIASYPYVILIILTFFNLFQRPGLLSSVFLSLAVLMLYFSGGVQALYYTLFILSLVAVIQLVLLIIKQGLPKVINSGWKKLPFLALAGFLTLGMAAFQLSVAWQHTQVSQRTQLSYADASTLPVKDPIISLFLGSQTAIWENLLFIGFF